MSYDLKQYFHWHTFTLGNGWQYLTQWDVHTYILDERVTTNCNKEDEHNYILDEKINENYSDSFWANKTVLQTSFFGMKLT